jgi:hypothetical protein
MILLEEMVVDKRRVSFLYRDQNLYTFMDSQNYEQYTLSEESLDGQIQWLIDGLEGITALLRDGHPLCIELPQTIDLEIVDTAPVIKGATATNRNKPADTVQRRDRAGARIYDCGESRPGQHGDRPIHDPGQKLTDPSQMRAPRDLQPVIGET